MVSYAAMLSPCQAADPIQGITDNKMPLTVGATLRSQSSISIDSGMNIFLILRLMQHRTIQHRSNTPSKPSHTSSNRRGFGAQSDLISVEYINRFGEEYCPNNSA